LSCFLLLFFAALIFYLKTYNKRCAKKTLPQAYASALTFHLTPRDSAYPGSRRFKASALQTTTAPKDL